MKGRYLLRVMIMTSINMKKPTTNVIKTIKLPQSKCTVIDRQCAMRSL